MLAFVLCTFGSVAIMRTSVNSGVREGCFSARSGVCGRDKTRTSHVLPDSGKCCVILSNYCRGNQVSLVREDVVDRQ